MSARDTLADFLHGTLKSRWVERYCGLVAKPKNEGKFLDDLHHHLMDRLDLRAVVEALPESAWSSPAFSFSAADGFGKRHSSLREAHSGFRDAILAITTDGRHGFHREEDLMDTEVLLARRGAEATR